MQLNAFYLGPVKEISAAGQKQKEPLDELHAMAIFGIVSCISNVIDVGRKGSPQFHSHSN